MRDLIANPRRLQLKVAKNPYKPFFITELEFLESLKKAHDRGADWGYWKAKMEMQDEQQVQERASEQSGGPSSE